MAKANITYRKPRKYKYQLLTDYSVSIDINEEVSNSFIQLSADGTLTIKEKYSWDGPSGPTIDTKSFMRGSLVHDALYQLMREDLLDRNVYRKKADLILKELCKEDKMWSLRALYSYWGVRLFGESSSKPDKKYNEPHVIP